MLEVQTDNELEVSKGEIYPQLMELVHIHVVLIHVHIRICIHVRSYIYTFNVFTIQRNLTANGRLRLSS